MAGPVVDSWTGVRRWFFRGSGRPAGGRCGPAPVVLALVAALVGLAACTRVGVGPPGSAAPVPQQATAPEDSTAPPTADSTAAAPADPAAPGAEGEPGAGGEQAPLPTERADPAGPPFPGGDSLPGALASAPPPGPGGSEWPEVRAVWVVRFTLAHPDSVRAMVERVADAGFNTLLVQVRGRGDAWYRSDLEPRAPALQRTGPAFDPLALVVEEAHRRNLRVHAWMNMNLVAGVGPLPEDPTHVVRSHPGWLAVPRGLASRLAALDAMDPAYLRALHAWSSERRDRVEGVYATPAAPGYREHVAAVVRDVVERYAVDGVHLDYIRYPSAEFDYSAAALEGFRRRVLPGIPPERGRELAEGLRRNPLHLTEVFPEEWRAFRQDAVRALVEEVGLAVRAVRPLVVLSAAVAPDPEEAARERLQAWTRWVDEGLVDRVALMAYTSHPERFGGWVEEGLRRAGRERAWIGVGAWLNELDATAEQVRRARAAGAAGVSLFSYDWLVARPGIGPGGSYLQGVAEQGFRGGN